MYGNRDLKTCFYIPILGVRQISFHNLDNSLVYTAPRQSRAFVASPPLETLSVTPSNVSWARQSFCLPPLRTAKNRRMNANQANAPGKSSSNELDTLHRSFLGLLERHSILLSTCARRYEGQDQGDRVSQAFDTSIFDIASPFVPESMDLALERLSCNRSCRALRA